MMLHLENPNLMWKFPYMIRSKLPNQIVIQYSIFYHTTTRGDWKWYQTTLEELCCCVWNYSRYSIINANYRFSQLVYFHEAPNEQLFSVGIPQPKLSFRMAHYSMNLSNTKHRGKIWIGDLSYNWDLQSKFFLGVSCWISSLSSVSFWNSTLAAVYRR